MERSAENSQNNEDVHDVTDGLGGGLVTHKFKLILMSIAVVLLLAGTLELLVISPP